MRPITIIGGGLAGCEAAWQLAQRGAEVILYEMRPFTLTEAHKTDLLAELVCSNSLRSDSLDRAQGILKAELRLLGSLIIACADRHRIPAGSALAVDRHLFAATITEAVSRHPNIELRREEVTELPLSEPTIIASGPLTSPSLAKAIFALTGQHYLFFYDAISPIVDAESIDMNKAFMASRYGKGEAAYLNCPLTQAEYNAFYEALTHAEQSMHADVDPDELFEGCLPIEVIAGRGYDALLFGPMKPVGLVDPRTGERPYAVVQLRSENADFTMYNLVGFQTSLRWAEQERVFRMIPGLEQAEFLRYGAVHRNTYINSPSLLQDSLNLKSKPHLYFAGQITGVEGYVESTACGLVAALNCLAALRGEPAVIFPRETVIGALMYHITHADPKHFQPMNANFGVLPPIPKSSRQPKRERRERMARRCLTAMKQAIAERGGTVELSIPPPTFS
ncbi:MAG: methylenetetrahydrofolate--tRNA-(uracil(54)-C(5))-methyltransferase (FADH(2)-oxidizing) TrmFO [Candidatus Zipacnadales bacterium]